MTRLQNYTFKTQIRLQFRHDILFIKLPHGTGYNSSSCQGYLLHNMKTRVHISTPTYQARCGLTGASNPGVVTGVHCGLLASSLAEKKNVSSGSRESPFLKQIGMRDDSGEHPMSSSDLFMPTATHVHTHSHMHL